MIPDYDLANLDPKTTFRWNLGRNRLENSILIFRKCPKIDENGPEWGRGESPRAHIRRGRSYGLSDASGSLPDPFWGGFQTILMNFMVLGPPSGKTIFKTVTPYFIF